MRAFPPHHRRHTPDEKGEVTCPDITGGTNFYPPVVRSHAAAVLRQRPRSLHDLHAWKPEDTAGDRFTGGAGQRVRGPGSPVYGALRAIDPTTGERKWQFKDLNPSDRGPAHRPRRA